MNDFVRINYSSFMILVMAIFCLVGLLRGWWKEGITTSFLTILVLLLKKPVFAVAFTHTVNLSIANIYYLIRSLIRGANDFSSASYMSAPAINPTEYSLYVYILVGLVIFSYLLGKFTLGNTPVSWGGRIIGVFLSIFNGYLIINLVREYLLGRYLPGNEVMAAAAISPAPPIFMVQFSNMPSDSLVQGSTGWLIILLGAAIAIIVIGSGWTLEKFRPRKRLPPGYGSPRQMAR